MRNKIIETVNKMSDAEIESLYEHIFGTGATKDAKIDADHKMLEKKFGIKVMQDFAQMCIGTVVGIDTLADFVKYRNEIKKPIKTARPLKAYAQELIKISNAGYDIKQAIEIMKYCEWQQIQLEWIAKKIQKRVGVSDLSQFGFAKQNEKELLKWLLK